MSDDVKPYTREELDALHRAATEEHAKACDYAERVEALRKAMGIAYEQAGRIDGLGDALRTMRRALEADTERRSAPISTEGPLGVNVSRPLPTREEVERILLAHDGRGLAAKRGVLDTLYATLAQAEQGVTAVELEAIDDRLQTQHDSYVKSNRLHALRQAINAFLRSRGIVT